jgi:putative membrane protein
MKNQMLVTKFTLITTAAATAFGLMIGSVASAHPMGEVRDGLVGIVATHDEQWIMDSARSSLQEIQLAQLALSKTTETAIHDYATKVIQDHTQALKDLQDLGTKKRIVLPTVLNPDQMVIVEYFRNSTSPDWGRDYIKYEIADHTQGIADTQKEISDGVDADTKAEATKMLPVLQEHLKMAQDIDAAPVPH